MNVITRYLHRLVNLSEHIDVEAASANIKKAVPFRGPNVFILAFAIVIASVGLNVNSTPVIIGAMLISPLMGPILGFGMGLGTNDTKLVRDSLHHFAIMVGISILASTLYFLITPLSLNNQSELLARTNPTIYDVMIALFGGLAGILENSRKEKGTVLAGVAIATALMPPLCTVGYGLANFSWTYIGGAFYLFLINCIFIALATFLGVKYLHFPKESYTEESRRKKSNRIISVVILIIIVPSVFSAWEIIRENNFTNHAQKIVADNRNMGKSYIFDHKINASAKPATIDLFIAGDVLEASDKDRIYADAESFGITRSQIIFHEDATNAIQNMSESEVIKGIYERNDIQMEALNKKIEEQDAELTALRSRIIPSEAIVQEITAQYPGVSGISITRGETFDVSTGGSHDQIIATISSTDSLSTQDIARISGYLKARLGIEEILVLNL